MTLTRQQFDYIWRIGEQRDPELVTRSCNEECAVMEEFFAHDGPRFSWEKLAEFYLTPRTTEKQPEV